MNEVLAIPEELGVKISTKNEVLWKRIEEETKKIIEELENSLIVQKGFLELSQNKILEEKQKLK